MADDWAPKPSSAPAHRAATHPRPAPSGSAPFDRITQFLGKAHSAMMKAFTFHCQQNQDVVSRLIESKNSQKARLRDSGAADVSEDERLPEAPPAEFSFPSGPEWADFFDEARGSGTRNADDDA